jgi:A/G-specific adenine glycosylase
MDFTAELLTWYHAHHRDLPWKDTGDPYKIWLSEIILQQTRVTQGLPYYLRFIERFPTVESLAEAHVDEVLRLWQGLGYYSRARNLHQTAQTVAKEHQGKFPGSYTALLRLKGIGPYTAAAIASFAYKEAVPAIDGNAYRILSRVFGMTEAIDSASGKKQFAELGASLIAPKHPGAFNQALMDFGSLVCTPKPLCDDCPMQAGCYAFAHACTDKLPVKSKRPTIRQRYFYCLFIRQGENTFIRKRTEKDIWQGLYEFPVIETTRPVAPQELPGHRQWKALLGSDAFKITHISEVLKHQLTHQTIHAVFFSITLKKPTKELAANYLKIPLATLDHYSLPRLLTLFLENLHDI